MLLQDIKRTEKKTAECHLHKNENVLSAYNVTWWDVISRGVTKVGNVHIAIENIIFKVK